MSVALLFLCATHPNLTLDIGNSAGRGPFGANGYQNLGVSAASDDVKNWFLDCGFSVVSVTARNLTFTFVDNHGRIKYQTTLEEPMNANRLSVTDSLHAIAMAPHLLGVVILVPITAIAVGLIAYLGKDFFLAPKETLPQKTYQSSSRAFQSQQSVQRGPADDSDIDSSAWSQLDVSTDRLHPSRHGP